MLKQISLKNYKNNVGTFKESVEEKILKKKIGDELYMQYVKNAIQEMVPIFKLIVTDDADSDLAKAIGYLSDRNAQRFSKELFQKYENNKTNAKTISKNFL